MPTLKIVQLRQRFRKSVEYLWRYRIFAGTVYRLKVANFQMLLMRQCSQHCHCKNKIPARLKLFHPNSHRSKSSMWGEYFENRLNTFWDIGFFLAQCTGWKWQTFKCCRLAKFSPSRCKSKIPAHLKLLPPYAHPQNLRAEVKMFENRLNTFWDIGFLLAQCTGWKWQTFKCCRRAKFSPCHWETKIHAHLKLSTQMPTLKIFELRERFRKSVEYLWKYKIFAGTVYRLKVANFQMLSIGKVFTFPLQK